MRHVLAAVAVLAVAGTAAADPPFASKPIDTSKYLIQPADQAAGFFSGATKTATRVLGGSIEQNGFVRTINNLFGTKQMPQPVQPTGLPDPGSFPSTKYQNSFTPRMPTSTQYQR